MSAKPGTPFELADLNDVYVNMPREDSTDPNATQTISVADMSDDQYRTWIVAKAKMHGVQILPTMGQISAQTRLALINRLIRHGVRIYKAPPGTPRWQA